MGKAQADDPLGKGRITRKDEFKRLEQKWLEYENARLRVLWAPGKTSFAAVRLDEAHADGDAAGLAEKLLNYAHFRWRILECLDGGGLACKMAVVEAKAGESLKLWNFVRQMRIAIKGLKAAFMDGGRAQAFSDDGACADLGAFDPADFEALARKLTGSGSQVLCIGAPRYARYGNHIQAMLVQATYSSLDDPQSCKFVELAERLKPARNGGQ